MYALVCVISTGRVPVRMCVWGDVVCVGRCGVCGGCLVRACVPPRVVGVLECLLCIGAVECIQLMDARCWREV